MEWDKTGLQDKILQFKKFIHTRKVKGVRTMDHKLINVTQITIKKKDEKEGKKCENIKFVVHEENKIFALLDSNFEKIWNSGKLSNPYSYPTHTKTRVYLMSTPDTPDPPDELHGFVITDDDGTEYKFNFTSDKVCVEVRQELKKINSFTSPHSPVSHCSKDENVPSEWYTTPSSRSSYGIPELPNDESPTSSGSYTTPSSTSSYGIPKLLTDESEVEPESPTANKSLTMAKIPLWIPLESNPEVLTKYSRTLGAKIGQWVSVDGFDDDILAHILDVKAVIFVFPITPQYVDYCKEQDNNCIIGDQPPALSDVYYMKQTVHNACGTVGIIHSLANNVESLELEDGTLKTFLAHTKNLTPEERGETLEKSDTLVEAHNEYGTKGQSAASNPEDQVVTHFLSFIEKNGQLYELDGRRKFPINHGPTTTENFLRDAAKVCESRIKALETGSTSEYRFSVIALSLST